MKHVRIKRDAGELLAAALVELGNSSAHIVRREGTNWASATFTGMRHKVEMQFPGMKAIEAGRTLASILPEHEFTLRGHIVADISAKRSVETDGVLTLEIEALTVEDV